jgi:hypothetical protein
MMARRAIRAVIGVFISALAASFPFAAPPPLAPGFNEFRVELPQDLRRIAGRGTLSPVTHARVTIATPARPAAEGAARVLVVSATSDLPHRSSRRLLEAYAPVATARGWIALAADAEPAADPADDHVPLRLALNTAALSVLEARSPGAGNVPLAFAGFSGGAKYSGWLAAAFARQGRPLIGVYLSGSNEETLVDAARQFDVFDAGFKRVPVFLHAGATDELAGVAELKRLATALRRSGFENVRTVTAPGGHAVDSDSLGAALDWFREFAPHSIQ